LAFGLATPATGVGWCPVAVAAGPATYGWVLDLVIDLEFSFSFLTYLGRFFPFAFGLATPATGVG